MRKILYIMIGCISLGLGIIGVILPIFPTVPFVLLAAFCFARSSERLDGWFKNTKLYKENNMKSGMTKRAKVRIMCSVTLLMSIGFIMVQPEQPAFGSGADDPRRACHHARRQVHYAAPWSAPVLFPQVRFEAAPQLQVHGGGG